MKLDTLKKSCGLCLLQLGKKQGFSLVEVMIAMSVFAMIMLGTFKALGESTIITEKRKDMDMASQLIQREMEYLRSQNWATIEGLSAKSAFVMNGSSSGFNAFCYASDRASRTDQRIVKLEVSWENCLGTTQSVSAITFFTKNGNIQ